MLQVLYVGSYSRQQQLCVDRAIIVNGFDPRVRHMGKRVTMPIGISFKTENWPNEDGGNHFKMIFKKGTDMWQEQLMIQKIGLMGSLLQKESLVLQLAPYKVLATSGPREDCALHCQRPEHRLRHQRVRRRHQKYMHSPPRTLVKKWSTYLARFCQATPEKNSATLSGSGDQGKSEHRLVSDATASASWCSGGLALPNIRVVCD